MPLTDVQWDERKIEAAQSVVRAYHRWKLVKDKFGTEEEKEAREELEVAMRRFKYYQHR